MSAIVNLNAMAGNTVDTYLQSVQNTVAMDNGSLVALGTVVANNPNVRNCAAPTDITTQELYLVASPEIVEVNGLRVELSDPSQFTNPANRPARAYKLVLGDTFTITDTGFTGTSVVGQYLIGANGALKPAASATIGTAKLGLLVLEKTTISTGRTRNAATKVQVVKA
jgi:hypothetical protein